MYDINPKVHNSESLLYINVLENATKLLQLVNATIVMQTVVQGRR